MFFCTLFVFLLALTGLALPVFCSAQDQHDRRFEAGAQFSLVNLTWVNEYPGGLGGRFSYDLAHWNQFILAPEIEANYFPQNRLGHFGQTEMLAGIKTGIRAGRIGLFAKVRPGLMHFSGRQFETFHLGPSTNFALDMGGVFEYYTNSGIFFRIDMGDTVVYAPEPFFRSLPPFPGSTGNFHGLQTSLGMGFRF